MEFENEIKLGEKLNLNDEVLRQGGSKLGPKKDSSHPMEIVIMTIPHKEQRYETVGDYWKGLGGSTQIRVSDMDNADYEFLVALHELVEQKLCEKRGIKEEDITAFDIEFENNRAEDDDSEPGDDPMAPYKKEHLFATGIEKLVAAELGIDWKTYDEKVMSL
jgi:hypothetical protein